MYSTYLALAKLSTAATALRGDTLVVAVELCSRQMEDTIKETLLSQWLAEAEAVTRGHNKRIYKQRARLNIRKFSFCNRVVNSWNGLPSTVVNANSVMDFEGRLDRVWKKQEQRYQYDTPIAGMPRSRDHVTTTIGNSNIELELQAV